MKEITYRAFSRSGQDALRATITEHQAVRVTTGSGESFLLLREDSKIGEEVISAISNGGVIPLSDEEIAERARREAIERHARERATIEAQERERQEIDARVSGMVADILARERAKEAASADERAVSMVSAMMSTVMDKVLTFVDKSSELRAPVDAEIEKARSKAISPPEPEDAEEASSAPPSQEETGDATGAEEGLPEETAAPVMNRTDNGKPFVQKVAAPADMMSLLDD